MRAPHPSERRSGALIIPWLIAASGAVLLLYQWHWGRMLWLDEEMLAINLRERSLTQLAGRLSLGQAAPWGWLAIERGLLLVSGGGERALRALPLMFGIAFLGTAVWIGARWLNAAGATTLAFLCAAGQWVSFYALELKPYSADTCFGLLLPALAVWAVEQDRALVWWLSAAAAQWFANGALFVVPACAVVIVSVRGIRAAIPGVLWLALFLLNFAINLGPVRGNEFLLHYWANAFPPAGAGVVTTLQWVLAQVPELALKPGGSGFGSWFWALAAAGLLVATRISPRFRIVFALVPLSALLFAAIRLVPMFERLSLWMIPSLYVGVASLADAGWSALAGPQRRRGPALGLVGAGALVVILLLLVDVARRGTTYVSFAEPIANHEVDDRAAVRWLARQRQPGDVWVTTHNALAAVWWYADDRLPMIETALDSDPDACGTAEIGAWLQRAGASRALVYLGFGHHVPPAFDAALIGRLGSLGSIVSYSHFGENSHALIVDLRQRPSGEVTLESLGAPQRSPVVDHRGCITVSEGVRW